MSFRRRKDRSFPIVSGRSSRKRGSKALKVSPEKSPWLSGDGTRNPEGEVVPSIAWRLADSQNPSPKDKKKTTFVKWLTRHEHLKVL